jgi:hypothetical protein
MVLGSELLMNRADGERAALAQSLRRGDPEAIEQLIKQFGALENRLHLTIAQYEICYEGCLVIRK